MQVGIVGLPNVGKSTLFKALTKKQVDASNYPFCTIDPNVGVVSVPDQRLEKLAAIYNSEKVTPTVIEFVDIAGLVKNAHKGEGLGNQFLSHIREVDAIIEVLRDFEDKNITHVEGDINPERDKNIIHLELIMADMESVEKRLTKLKKEGKAGDKQILKKIAVLEKINNVLQQEKFANTLELEDEEKLMIKDLNLLTLKPIIFVYNQSSYAPKSAKADKSPKPSKQASGQVTADDQLVVDAKLEAELSELSEEEVKEYLQELNIQKTGLDKLINTSYKILDLITFFTAGVQESRAWTVKRGAKAPQAAGRIHTDFEKGFIRAEVCDYDDYIANNGELGAKEKGLVRLEGKEYVVQDGDVIYFRVAT